MEKNFEKNEPQPQRDGAKEKEANRKWQNIAHGVDSLFKRYGYKPSTADLFMVRSIIDETIKTEENLDEAVDAATGGPLENFSPETFKGKSSEEQQEIRKKLIDKFLYLSFAGASGLDYEVFARFLCLRFGIADPEKFLNDNTEQEISALLNRWREKEEML